MVNNILIRRSFPHPLNIHNYYNYYTNCTLVYNIYIYNTKYYIQIQIQTNWISNISISYITNIYKIIIILEKLNSFK